MESPNKKIPDPFILFKKDLKSVYIIISIEINKIICKRSVYFEKVIGLKNKITIHINKYKYEIVFFIILFILLLKIIDIYSNKKGMNKLNERYSILKLVSKEILGNKVCKYLSPVVRLLIVIIKHTIPK
jgi:hypothetical protein